MTTSFVLAVLLFSLTASFAAGDPCNNVPTMTWEEACVKACATDPDNAARLELCKQTLQSGPDSAEVTVYVLIATRLAKLKYEDTMAEMDQMMGPGNLGADEKAAISLCKKKYGEASSLLASVNDQLFACDLSRVRQEFIDAQVAVGACQNSMWAYQSMSLLTKVSADNDLTVVAYLLGALIVGR
ncbi:hypothetical protein U9M48_040923 [Paspalum notatum var. saurae]|uniref:Pectinesterase inhibitor domain-containing protein n=1 Tax=Paspalum notatum var. saurae TaxID=547442 RepID=A0AAQ3URK4_PASNO